jgi:phosphate-selective porin OprO/OprP
MRKIPFIIALLLLAVPAALAQKNAKYNQYGVQVKSDRLDVEAQDGILVLESPTSGYKLWFDIRAQADAAVFFGAPEYADPIGNGAQIRRARFAVKGQIDEKWYGEFDMDLANGLAELKDAIVRYTGVPNLDLQVGNFKENFSIQRNTTSRYLQFMERPMVCSALTPSRHIGINAKYAKNWLWFSTGLFSQVIAGQEEWTNVADNNKDFGRNSGYAWTTKLVVRPLYKLDNASLHIGAAYSYRTTTTDMATGEWGTYRASARNSTSINRKKYLDTNNLPGFDHNNLWTVELAGHWGGLRYEAAYIGDNVHFKPDAADPETKNFNGWYAQAGYLLFGGKQRYDSNGGKYTKVERAHDWGDVELCARYETCNLNFGNVFGGASEAYTLGLNYWVNENVKMQLNYQFNNNDRYATGKGKLNVGLDSNGKPTKDFTKVATATGKAGVDYHMVAFRFEIDF